jgi:hypothetical protein
VGEQERTVELMSWDQIVTAAVASSRDIGCS